MNISKLRFILLGASVLSLAVVMGTLLWLKLTPRTVYYVGSDNSLEGLNQYGAVPDFSLTERSGKKVKLGDLRGHIWIADFIYTSCTDTCPMQTATMARLQDQWANETNLQLVSFSVDPARDTPAVLSEYAGRYKADAKRWLFLTGGKEEIARLVQEGFRLSAVPAPDGGVESGVILHSPRFVLIDKQSQIRGYYDSRDPEALERLKKDVATLLNGKKE
jgi:cytochrome oxidase Cu insertion factor (SCO1/SenC/PrrC family)